jgi:23S rRNA (guanosine2251-2'-O)-methyltransferase
MAKGDLLKKNQICIGRQPVVEALESGTSLDRIYIQRGSTGDILRTIDQLAAEAKVPVNYVPKEKLMKLTNLRHQGVLALLSEINYFNIEDIIDQCYEEGRDPLVVILDGVTDVRNFGAICRTALGMNVDAVVVGFNDAAPVNEISIKASAGALHHIKICRHKRLEQVVDYLKQSGIQILSLVGKSESYIHEQSLNLPIAIIMGAEDKGVSETLLKYTDISCKIPMNETLESYNVSVAAAMMLYEINRQRTLL